VAHKTCAYCDHHTFSDSKWDHVCLCDGSEKTFDESCDRFRKSRRGGYLLTGYTNVINMDELESRVADDKYTRGK
jgi:hypothetical protein